MKIRATSFSTSAAKPVPWRCDWPGQGHPGETFQCRFHITGFDDDFHMFENTSLDGLCAYSILHLLADRGTALENISRLLKPGVFFISSTACLGDAWIP